MHLLMLLQLHVTYNLYSLNVSGFPDTDSTLKSQAEGDGVPLGVTNQKKQDVEDNTVERPQDKLSMCNVKLLSFPSGMTG